MLLGLIGGHPRFRRTVLSPSSGYKFLVHTSSWTLKLKASCEWKEFKPNPFCSISWFSSCESHDVKLTVKLPLCIRAVSHGIWGSRIIDPYVHNLDTRWMWVVIFTLRPIYLHWKRPPYCWNKRLGRTHSRFTCFSKETNPSPSRIEPHFLDRAFHGLVTVLTELSQLQVQQSLVTSVPFLRSGCAGMLPPLWSCVAKFPLFLPQLVNSLMRTPITGCLESSYSTARWLPLLGAEPRVPMMLNGEK
jgi:hypothetical protein